MGASNSTRRVSFESDENENITVVKGIRLSENVINRMREPVTPPKHEPAPTPPPSMAPTLTPSPLLRPVPPLFDPVTSLPPPPPIVEPVAPPAHPPPAPFATETVAAPPPTPPQPPTEQPAEPFAAPPLPEFTAPCDPVAPPPQPQVEPVSPAPVPEPVVVPESSLVPPPPAAPPVDKEALRKKITDELYKSLDQDRAKAERELQAWLEEEKARSAAQAQADAQSQVRGEVSRLLSVERAVAQESLQQAVIRERIATEDEKLRAQLFEIGQKVKQLEAREADLKKQDAFYREQVARLEERSAQFYKVTTENYHKAADQVNAKFKRYEMYPVCADLQGQILACYKENVGKTLNCSNIASLYLQCVNNAKQNNKYAHVPSWTDDITS
ncbi:coiled-coil-helix-coiled-coil-helix domain containing 3a isoform X6 [Dicentrarchus labrax]|uniref:coiled-coil-helix-coiled-coil-helix domain containing 3a isoform X6 n=1 Tax=Dicentrarchus labrax TaxID=13489 RepID=UPI0021F5B6BD|nr:coiled-coil-helix-coiled-coil-helix domain containing 3a isoform X6 [Dicentrarchus labrax]